MKMHWLSMAALGLLFSLSCQAAAPAGAPAGATALCKDGSYYTGAEKKGACSGHKGLKDWYGVSAAKAATSTAKPVSAAPASTKPAAAANATPAQAPGKPGMVWVNMDTKVYHCPNTRWYGKTKNGKYLTEADAKAQGMRPDHNKACGK